MQTYRYVVKVVLLGQAVPRAPIQAGKNLPNCTSSSRKATLPEDKSVQIAGWMLFGSAQVFGSTTLISAMTDADAQCRPLGFQYFVFKNGNFVGTLSPNVMNSRTDGSLFKTDLFNENEITAMFNRYKDSDAQCCASRESRLFYTIKKTGASFVLEPKLPASTTATSR
jgi:hypothetical protein